jgi:hypothetical protein
MGQNFVVLAQIDGVPCSLAVATGGAILFPGCTTGNILGCVPHRYTLKCRVVRASCTTQVSGPYIKVCDQAPIAGTRLLSADWQFPSCTNRVALEVT